jgi:hypothetical protein
MYKSTQTMKKQKLFKMISTVVFWVVMPFGLVGSQQCFKRMHYFHLQPLLPWHSRNNHILGYWMPRKSPWTVRTCQCSSWSTYYTSHSGKIVLKYGIHFVSCFSMNQDILHNTLKCERLQNVWQKTVKKPQNYSRYAELSITLRIVQTCTQNAALLTVKNSLNF